MKKLTQKQHSFVLAYLETGNRVESYRRAYDCGTMAKATISRKAQEVAALPHVAELIEQHQNDAIARHAVTVDKVLEFLAGIAFTDISEFIDYDGKTARIKDASLLTPNQRAALKDFVVSKNGGLYVRLHDSLRALELLGKHLGMFGKKALPQDNVPIINFIISGDEP